MEKRCDKNNATVLGHDSECGTLTNEHGFYVPTLSEREDINPVFALFGSGEHLEDVTLGGNQIKEYNSEVRLPAPQN